ncbi:MAG: TraR/DksA C4-type zinc finger protein [Parafilimonas sp.]
MPTKKHAPKKAVKSTHKVVNKKAAPAKKAVPAKKTVVKKVSVVKSKSAKASSKSKPVAKPISKKGAIAKKALKKPVVKHTKPAVKHAKPANHHLIAKKTNHEPVNLHNHRINKAAPKRHEPIKEIKIPKTTVKTSVPYQPEYKSMDQRHENNNNKLNVPLIRYTDTELAEFRELINKKLDAAKKELAYLQGLITRKDDMGGDESETRYMTMEDGSISMEREQLSQMASRQITYIDHLEKALIRIENKTYGICRVTGRLIDKARLRAVPHATLSLEAKMGFAKAASE